VKSRISEAENHASYISGEISKLNRKQASAHALSSASTRRRSTHLLTSEMRAYKRSKKSAQHLSNSSSMAPLTLAYAVRHYVSCAVKLSTRGLKSSQAIKLTGVKQQRLDHGGKRRSGRAPARMRRRGSNISNSECFSDKLKLIENISLRAALAAIEGILKIALKSRQKLKMKRP